MLLISTIFRRFTHLRLVSCGELGILLGQGVSREGVHRAIKQVELFQCFHKGREANCFGGWMLDWDTLGLACLDKVLQRVFDS